MRYHYGLTIALTFENIWQLPSSAPADEEAREFLSDGSVVWIKKEKPAGGNSESQLAVVGDMAHTEET
jgi:hypothetical protein